MDDQQQGAGLSVAAVARRMGIAPATLRTWDRRYGVGPSAHEAGTHRRYSPTDLARLEYMRRLLLEGVSPADAAKAALGAPAESISRPGGGHVIAQPGAAPAVRGLARAAQAMDIPACEQILCDTIAKHGVIWTWDHLIVPVLHSIGERWENTGRGVEIEHALSSAVLSALMDCLHRMADPVNRRTVLLACAPKEVHTLPLWAVAAALGERRVGCRVLGPGLPPIALIDAVSRLSPAAVFVWSHVSGAADVSQLALLPAHRPRSLVLVGGAGWTGPLPLGVTKVDDLADTVAQLAHAVGE